MMDVSLPAGLCVKFRKKVGFGYGELGQLGSANSRGVDDALPPSGDCRGAWRRDRAILEAAMVAKTSKVSEQRCTNQRKSRICPSKGYSRSRQDPHLRQQCNEHHA